MADEEQLAVLRQGKDAWNAWRGEQNLRHLTRADLVEANLSGADLSGANLSDALLAKANLVEANLAGASLSRNYLNNANLSEVNLFRANLSGASLRAASLFRANFTKASLSGANLMWASLVETDFTDADLTGCNIHGVSAWNVNLEGAEQKNLVITDGEEPEVTVDNLEVAQFIYLLLNNERVRHVIDTITSKVVLILGRFTDERKVVLDALRDELRQRDYTPVLFDFDKPASKDLTGTVQTLANMARFIIADVTDPSSVPHELATLVPGTVVPVQPVLLEGSVSTRCSWT
jgi:uncharacterized protein YjbI with pentapeptide repeats